MFILGCDHCLQEPECTSGFWQPIERTPRARRQREGFRTLIEQIISDHRCGFIGEETNEGKLTPAASIAERLRRRGEDIRYHNIEMTLAERRAAGVPTEDYEGNPRYDAEQVITWHRLREEHMIGEIGEHRGESENLLIICGVRHMTSLAGYFQRRGEDVAPLRDATKAEWFSGPLSTEWLDQP